MNKNLPTVTFTDIVWDPDDEDSTVDINDLPTKWIIELETTAGTPENKLLDMAVDALQSRRQMLSFKHTVKN